MSFFDEIDSLKILERNAKKIASVEEYSARKLIAQYRKAIDDIKNQLLFSESNTYTEAKLKNTLLQLEKGLEQFHEKVRPTLFSFFDDTSSLGVEDSIREVNAFEKHFEGVTKSIDMDAVIESTDPDTFLFNKFDASIQNYDQNLRMSFQNSLTQSLLQQKTWSQAVWDMENTYRMSEYEIARIVRTELHGIYSGAKFNGFLSVRDDYIPDLKKTLYHPMDSRTGDDSKIAAHLNLIADLDEPFKYSYKGKDRVFMFPPDRPHDRSILIPYREKYARI